MRGWGGAVFGRSSCFWLAQSELPDIMGYLGKVVLGNGVQEPCTKILLQEIGEYLAFRGHNHSTAFGAP